MPANPRMVIVVPLTPLLVQIVGVIEVKVTALPDAPPVALTVNAGAVLSSEAGVAAKVIVCGAWAMVILSAVEVATR